MIARRLEESNQGGSVIVPPILLKSVVNVNILLLTAINGTLTPWLASSAILITCLTMICVFQIVLLCTPDRARLTTLLTTQNASVMTSILPLTQRLASSDADFAQI